jgi:hypothetical protein
VGYKLKMGSPSRHGALPGLVLAGADLRRGRAKVPSAPPNEAVERRAVSPRRPLVRSVAGDLAASAFARRS